MMEAAQVIEAYEKSLRIQGQPVKVEDLTIKMLQGTVIFFCLPLIIQELSRIADSLEELVPKP